VVDSFSGCSRLFGPVTRDSYMFDLNHKMQIFCRVVNFFGDSRCQIVQKSQGGTFAQAVVVGEKAL
jgi:hypothetical protein